MIWEASDRVCGKRLRPLVPLLVNATERHGHLALDAGVRAGLLAMSAAAIDRALGQVRGQAGRRTHRHAPPSAAIRQSVAVRTFEIVNDPPPGFMEADLVAHSGPTAKGSFVQTLTVTDIASARLHRSSLSWRVRTDARRACANGASAGRAGAVSPSRAGASPP